MMIWIRFLLRSRLALFELQVVVANSFRERISCLLLFNHALLFIYVYYFVILDADPRFHYRKKHHACLHCSYYKLTCLHGNKLWEVHHDAVMNLFFQPDITATDTSAWPASTRNTTVPWRVGRWATSCSFRSATRKNSGRAPGCPARRGRGRRRRILPYRISNEPPSRGSTSFVLLCILYRWESALSRDTCECIVIINLIVSSEVTFEKKKIICDKVNQALCVWSRIVKCDLAFYVQAWRNFVFGQTTNGYGLIGPYWRKVYKGWFGIEMHSSNCCFCWKLLWPFSIIVREHLETVLTAAQLDKIKLHLWCSFDLWSGKIFFEKWKK